MKKKLVLNRYESLTHVSISIFQGLFRNIVFRYVALVTILNSFYQRPEFPRCTQPNNALKNFFTKNPLNYFSLKVTKFHDDSDKNESARTKKKL